jgi:DNA invertase Pin-like site-specific DNA recombinase
MVMPPAYTSLQETEMRPEVRAYSYARWSSDGQADGDSDRRQTQMAEDWCSRRGLRLAGMEKDEGVSAWKGKNRSEGSGLSRLLKLVRPGDYLLVEDNDRLSRQDWLTAMNFLAEIVGKGVTVVTLTNGNEINEERFKKDPGVFLPAILRAHLGHDENTKKSVRIKASWQARKRKLAEGQAARMFLPCWLRWEKDTEKPVLVECNASVVRRMFDLALKGMGCQTIARRLIAEGCEFVLNSKHGRRSLSPTANYVWRTLRNKMVIGFATCIQPQQAGVFPAVVDENTFYAVQTLAASNRNQTVKRAHSTSSLFTFIARCSKCGGSLCRFTQSRHGKRYEYLVCSDSLHKHGRCGVAGVRYERLERSFVALMADTGLVRRAMATHETAQASPVDSLIGQLADVEAQIGKYLELIEGDPIPSRTLYAALKAAEAKGDYLRKRIDDERAAAAAKTATIESYEQLHAELAEKISEPDYREEFKALLRTLVDRVVVDIKQASYEVRFKHSAMPLFVKLGPRDSWFFAPDPDWLFDPANEKLVAAIVSAKQGQPEN